VTTYLPTLKQLQYLVALKDHGHFGRASEACFVTQSTLSAGLRELETLIGVTLVERTRRVVRFTPLGDRIAEKARRVLREADEISDMARAPKLRKDWPDLKLFLREETSQAACDNLHRGVLDCVLLALPFGCGEVESEVLFEDALWVAFPPGEEAGAAAIKPAEIDQDRLLLLEDGHCLRDHALAVCNRPELRAEAAMLGTSLHTTVQMVGNGLGVTIVPAMALEAGILEGTGVTARPLGAEHAYRRIALIWRKGSPREKDFRLLSEALRPAP
jgi:LysR family hydrogen peroxide-inducible transcriptional activator